jgi:hypothetical protein
MARKKEILMQDEERRHSERVAFLRRIVYIRDKSEKFISATMINFCSNGICFQSTPPVTPGEKVHIITEDNSTGLMIDKTGDAIVGEVMWCRKKAGAHRVGVQYLGYSVAGSSGDEIMSALDAYTTASRFRH